MTSCASSSRVRSPSTSRRQERVDDTMAVQRTFLNQPYGAYHNREVPREDEELTHVGPGTPGGEYLRRFWQPVAYAEDLKGLPLAVRVMGEDLVLFRDRSGRIGLLQRHCS